MLFDRRPAPATLARCPLDNAALMLYLTERTVVRLCACGYIEERRPVLLPTEQEQSQ